MTWIEWLTVGAIIAWATYALYRHLWHKPESGCGKGCGCEPAKRD